MRRLRRALLLLAAAPLLLMAQPTGSSEASAASARQPAVPGAMATDPLVMASQQLVESSADQYSDLWLEEATDTVFVGSVNAEADRRVQAVTNQFPECPTSAVSSAVRVERSSADLETIRGALFEDPLLDALLEPVYSYDGPDAKTGQVLLGVIRAPERLMSMVIKQVRYRCSCRRRHECDRGWVSSIGYESVLRRWPDLQRNAEATQHN